MRVFDNPSSGINYRKGAFQITGNNAEVAFETLARSKGYFVQKATVEENRFKHFDFVVFKEGKNYKVETKYLPKFEEYGNFNVQLLDYYGKPGAIFGESTHLAFLTGDTFFVFNRKRLCSYSLWYKGYTQLETFTQSGGKGEFFYLPYKEVLANVSCRVCPIDEY